MKVLVIEDDINLAKSIRNILVQNKYLVDLAHDGEEGLFYAQQEDYDVLVVDVMLPKMNGFDVTRSLRKDGDQTPLIMLTARTEVQDKVTGLDCGADDYLSKPFASEELLARLRALTRRRGEVVLDTLAYGDVTLDLSGCLLTHEDRSVSLSHKEFELLKLLINNGKMVSSKEMIIMKIWGTDSEAEDNNVEAYISFLRKKLRYVHSQVGIKTIRMVGYVLEEGEK